MAQVPQSPGTLWVRAGVLCSPAQALQPKATQTPTFRGWTDGNGEHVAIETVKAGDTLQARDADTGKVEARVVNRTSKVTSYELVTIEIADAASGKVVDTITGTPNHPFYVTGKGWVPLGKLGIGTSLVTRAGPSGGFLVVKSSRRESHPEGVLVYNFDVEGFHTYFVGTAGGGIWVHNGLPCTPDLGLLSGKSANVSPAGLEQVRNHLSQFGSVAENDAMIGRLQSAMNSGAKISGADLAFYTHELNEAMLMGRGMSYDAAHAAALSKYGNSPFSVYHPNVISSMPESFNSRWRSAWGL